MKDKLLNAATVVFAMVLVAVVGVSLWPPRTPTAAAALVREVPAGQALEREGQLMGSAEAPVRVVVFSDFECGHCARAAQEINELRRRWPEKVAIQFRHYPQEVIHPNAVAASLASECAAEQGRFEAYHDALFERGGVLQGTDWTEVARRAGVGDSVEFGRCLAEERHRARLLRDLEAGAAAGVQGTPAFVVDGRMVTGAKQAAVLDELIRKALEGRRS